MTQIIANESCIKTFTSISFDRTYSGCAYIFKDNSLIIVASAEGTGYVASRPLIVATCWNGINRIFEVAADLPILIEYLNYFQEYSYEMRRRIQQAIWGYHAPTSIFFNNHNIEWRRLIPEKQQTFACCSIAEIKIINGKFFFVAVTGPSREYSEGTVVGVVESGLSELALLPSGSKPLNVKDTYLTNMLKKETLNELDMIIYSVDRSQS
ncbi:hypothetical protein [Paenibacillus elgii]|uniref:hypothetical protein n=1 Tax=Paenibacillus elgii TaxID=189691 RepID=UPI0013D88318|nr:hypothetical protein [Paenibacillus elgii]